MAIRPSAPDTNAETASAPLGGTRAEAMQRLQVGASLLLGIVLIVGLANVIEERAKQSDKAVVPEAASTVAPTVNAAPANDPLADAGVVPDLPAQPRATASAPAGTQPARTDAGQ